MQKIKLIHPSILAISPNKVPHDPLDTTISDKIQTFTFAKFISACKEVVD